MGINYWAIIVCAVLSMIIGSIWYGPLFGKLWMRLCGMNEMDSSKKKEMQKKMMPLYLVQFVLTLFQLFVLTYLTGFSVLGGIFSALWVWAGFVMPTLAGTSMWSSEPRAMAWKRFFIQAGYQLVVFIVFGAILGGWH